MTENEIIAREHKKMTDYTLEVLEHTNVDTQIKNCVDLEGCPIQITQQATMKDGREIMVLALLVKNRAAWEKIVKEVDDAWGSVFGSGPR